MKQVITDKSTMFWGDYVPPKIDPALYWKVYHKIGLTMLDDLHREVGFLLEEK